MPTTDNQSKPRRSKFIVFTYVFQACMVILGLGFLTLAAFAFFAAEKWWMFLIYAVTFGIYFFTGWLWRSTERYEIAVRELRAEAAARWNS